MKALRSKLDSAKAALKAYTDLNERVNDLSKDILTKSGNALDHALTAFDDAFSRKNRAERLLLTTTKALLAGCGLQMANPKNASANYCSECIMVAERRIAQAEAILAADEFWDSLYVKPRNND